jgi:hypothetical protein
LNFYFGVFVLPKWDDGFVGQQRIIRCGGAVDDDMANLIVAQLLYLDAADPNRVCLISQSLFFEKFSASEIYWNFLHLEFVNTSPCIFVQMSGFNYGLRVSWV